MDTYIKNDFEKIKEQIECCSENEVNEEVEFLLEQAKEIGDSATKSIEDIIKELHFDINSFGDED